MPADKRNTKLISERKIKRNLTQAEVSESTGIPQTTISKMELGERPGRKWEQELADFYGIPAEELFEETSA